LFTIFACNYSIVFVDLSLCYDLTCFILALIPEKEHFLAFAGSYGDYTSSLHFVLFIT